jgi:hypothetical protein
MIIKRHFIFIFIFNLTSLKPSHGFVSKNNRKKKKKGKVYLTFSNYHLNDNLFLKLSIVIIYTSNYQHKGNILQIFKK